jgi:hypothetical protein
MWVAFCGGAWCCPALVLMLGFGMHVSSWVEGAFMEYNLGAHDGVYNGHLPLHVPFYWP